MNLNKTLKGLSAIFIAAAFMFASCSEENSSVLGKENLKLSGRVQINENNRWNAPHPVTDPSLVIPSPSDFIPLEGDFGVKGPHPSRVGASASGDFEEFRGKITNGNLDITLPAAAGTLVQNYLGSGQTMAVVNVLTIVEDRLDGNGNPLPNENYLYKFRRSGTRTSFVDESISYVYAFRDTDIPSPTASAIPGQPQQMLRFKYGWNAVKLRTEWRLVKGLGTSTGTEIETDMSNPGGIITGEIKDRYVARTTYSLGGEDSVPWFSTQVNMEAIVIPPPPRPPAPGETVLVIYNIPAIYEGISMQVLLDEWDITWGAYTVQFSLAGQVNNGVLRATIPLGSAIYLDHPDNYYKLSLSPNQFGSNYSGMMAVAAMNQANTAYFTRMFEYGHIFNPAEDGLVSNLYNFTDIGLVSPLPNGFNGENPEYFRNFDMPRPTPPTSPNAVKSVLPTHTEIVVTWTTTYVAPPFAINNVYLRYVGANGQTVQEQLPIRGNTVTLRRASNATGTYQIGVSTSHSASIESEIIWANPITLP